MRWDGIQVADYYWGGSFWLGLACIVTLSFSGVLYLGCRTRFLAQTITAMIAQLALALLFFFTFGLVTDDRLYHQASLVRADLWISGDSQPVEVLGPGKGSIVDVLGFLYFLFGPNPLLGLILNVSFMSAIPVVLGLSSRNFGFAQCASIAAWLGALSPPFLIWGPWLRREAAAFLLMSLVVLSLSLIYRRRFAFGVTLMALSVVALYSTRGQLVLVAGAGMLVVLGSLLFRHLPALSVRQRSAYILGIGCVTLALGAVLLNSQVFARFLDLPYLRLVVNLMAEPDSDLNVPGVSGDYNLTAAGLLYNLARSLWGPMPWEVETFKELAVFLDGLFMLALFVCIVQTWRKVPRARVVVLVLLVALAPLVIANAVTLANYGLNARIRAHYLPLLIPAAAISIRMGLSRLTHSRAVLPNAQKNRK